MGSNQQTCDNSRNLDKSAGGNTDGPDRPQVGKEERKRRVLGLLVETGLDLPPAVIFHNVRERGADFERRSVDNYLNELQSEGYVKKVDNKRGYYAATPEGRDYYLGR